MEGSSLIAGRCALEAELAHMKDMARELEAQIDPHGGGGGAAAAMVAGAEERLRALVSGMVSSIDRAIGIASTLFAEARLLQPAPESPPSADGTAGSDHGADSRCRANAAAQHKKRKTLPKWSKQVRVSSVQDVGPLDDGFSWRKYGQKDILGAKYPRAYFRCTHRHTQGCHASKQVQRANGDPLLFDVVYHGNHTCPQSRTPRTAASAEQNGGVSVAFIKPAKDEAGVVHEAQFSFTSTAPDGGAAGALLHGGCGGGGGGVTTAAASASSPFVSLATSDCVYELGDGGGSMAGVRNVPDVEFATKTANSFMGDDIEFTFTMDADFWDKYSGF